MTRRAHLLSEGPRLATTGVPFGVPKTSLLKGGEYQKKVSKTTSKSKNKTTYSGIWEQGHGFPPHISEAYLKNINKCFRIFNMFKPPSNTQKNQTKPQNSIAFFFRIEPRSCAARDFGMLSYSKLCKGLTKTSWIFFQPRWIGVCFDPKNSFFFHIF